MTSGEDMMIKTDITITEYFLSFYLACEARPRNNRETKSGSEASGIYQTNGNALLGLSVNVNSSSEYICKRIRKLLIIQHNR